MSPLARLVVTIAAIAIGLPGALTACAATDPLLSENTWHLTGVNEQNIAAEVVNPADLIRGRQSAAGSDGEMAAGAVLRLRTGHVKPLPDSAISDLHVQSAPASAGTP